MLDLQEVKRMLVTEYQHNDIIEIDGKQYITYAPPGQERVWLDLEKHTHSVHVMAIKIEDFYNKECENARRRNR